jgi:hypothetical protein
MVAVVYTPAGGGAAAVTDASTAREMIATIDTTGGQFLAGDQITFTYTATSPATSGSFAFVVQSRGSGEDDRALATVGSLTVTVTQAGDGSGAMTLDVTTVRAASGGNNFTFTYTAVETISNGELTITVPGNGWTPLKDGDTINLDETDVVFSNLIDPVANPAGNPDPGDINYEDSDRTLVIAIDFLPSQGTITVSYAGVTVQNFAQGGVLFITKLRFNAVGIGGARVELDQIPSVTVDNAAPGTGTAAYVGDSIPAAAGGVQLIFEFLAIGTMNGGFISLTVADGFTFPQGTEGVAGYTEASGLNGGTIGDVTFDGAGTVTIQITNNSLGAGQGVQVVYGKGSGSSGGVAPATASGYTFTVQSSGKSGEAAANIAVQPAVVVDNAADGSGSMTISPTEVPAGSTQTMRLTYSPIGTFNNGSVIIVTPDGWGDPTSSNIVIDTSDRNTQFGVPVIDGKTVTVPTDVLTVGQQLNMDYTAAVQTDVGTAVFDVRSQGSPAGDPVELDTPISVNVLGAADGSGTATLSLTPSPVTAGSSGNEVSSVYTAEGPINDGAVSLQLADDWTLEDTATVVVESTGTVGDHEIKSGSVIIEVPIGELTAGQTVTITVSGVTAQRAAGDAVFIVKSQGSADGSLVQVRRITRTVENASDGSGIATIFPTLLAPGGTTDADLTFEAIGTMANGRVRVTIPAGWTVSGAITVSSDGSVALVSATDTLITISITTLEVGETVVVSMQGVTGPTELGTGTFKTESRGSGPGTTTELTGGSPFITVTDAKEAGELAITGAESGFTGDALALTVGLVDSDGNPGILFNHVDINLSSDSATGVFDPNPVTILSGQSSVTVSYTDTTAGTSTITAADTAFTPATHGIAISAAISDVTVSGSPAGVGSVVSVTATGKPGAVAATFSVTNGVDIVVDKAMEESADGGTYTGEFTVVVDQHPDGTYDVTVNLDGASLTVVGALVIDSTAPPVAPPEFNLSIPAGISLIHISLDVTLINGAPASLNTVGDFFDVLVPDVSFLITYNSTDARWDSYLGDQSRGTGADRELTDDRGVIAVMSAGVDLTLEGNALGGGTSSINLEPGLNLVGPPLQDFGQISDLLNLPGVSSIITLDESDGEFKLIIGAGDAGDGPIPGGRSYIISASEASSTETTGEAWSNINGGGTAPPIAVTGYHSGAQTPVLNVHGSVVDEVRELPKDGIRLTVKNLSTGTSLNADLSDQDGYGLTFVDVISHAARVGDVLEVTAESPNPLLGIRPGRHIVTTDDVKTGRISLPDLVAYEIPALTELLPNFPNPFNPETWIPFRLAEDASVALTIYESTGRLVRTIDIGFTPAAIYESRSKAIYWDGRNNFGEQVASGIYFYHLDAESFSATRKMVILK